MKKFLILFAIPLAILGLSALSVLPTEIVHASTSCYTFTNNHKIGSSLTSAEATALKADLVNEGLWSSGVALTSYNATVAKAITTFQEKYSTDILAPNGLTSGNGFFGASTRAKINSLYGCTTSTASSGSSSGSSAGATSGTSQCPTGWICTPITQTNVPVCPPGWTCTLATANPTPTPTPSPDNSAQLNQLIGQLGSGGSSAYTDYLGNNGTVSNASPSPTPTPTPPAVVTSPIVNTTVATTPTTPVSTSPVTYTAVSNPTDYSYGNHRSYNTNGIIENDYKTHEIIEGKEPSDGSAIWLTMPAGYTTTGDTAPLTPVCGANQFYDNYGDGKCYMNTMPYVPPPTNIASIYPIASMYGPAYSSAGFVGSTGSGLTTSLGLVNILGVQYSNTRNSSATSFIGGGENTVDNNITYSSNFCKSPISINNAVALQKLSGTGVQGNPITMSKLLVLGSLNLSLNLDNIEVMLSKDKEGHYGYWWDGSIKYKPTGTYNDNGQTMSTETEYPYKTSDWTNPQFQALFKVLQLDPKMLYLCLDSNYVSNFPRPGVLDES